MLKSGRSIRFTATEIKELADLGIDISGAKSPHDFAATLEPWLDALGQTRPDLFDKITPVKSRQPKASGCRQTE